MDILADIKASFTREEDGATYERWRTWIVPVQAEIRFRVYHRHEWREVRASRVKVLCVRNGDHEPWSIRNIYSTGPIMTRHNLPGKAIGSELWHRDTRGLPEKFGEYADEFLKEINTQHEMRTDDRAGST